MSNRKLIQGWGINDSDYVVQPTGEDGKQHVCPIYRCWQHMIERCHSSKFQTTRQTYVGCWVDKRWRSFMAFRAWYLEQNPKPGEQLDKDFLGNGKLYSSETCCFIPPWLNLLFTDAGAIRGEWPQGVSYEKRRGKYRAQIKRKGKKFHIGYSDTPGEASAAYLEAKAAYVEELILENPHWPPRLAAAIRSKMAELIQQETVLI